MYDGDPAHLIPDVLPEALQLRPSHRVCRAAVKSLVGKAVPPAVDLALKHRSDAWQSMHHVPTSKASAGGLRQLSEGHLSFIAWVGPWRLPPPGSYMLVCAPHSPKRRHQPQRQPHHDCRRRPG